MNNVGFTKPPLSLPGFELDRLLGTGATGDVYLARQDIKGGLPAHRAVKVLNVGRLRSDLIGGRTLTREQMKSVERIEADVRRRFFAENQIGPALCHPSFVQYFGGGTVDDTPYIVMEYVPGVSSYDYVRDQVLATRPFSRSIRAEKALDEVARIGEQLASGLEFAHAQGIFHRDIKPENVRVTADPAGLRSARAKILDFGIAKIPPAKLGGLPVTQSRTICGFLGTPDFMAPEQCGAAETVDGRSDVFALGQTLLFLLTSHVLDWQGYRDGGLSGARNTAPMMPDDEVALARADVRRWVLDALALAAGELPTSDLESATDAWCELLVDMVRHDRKDRPTMKQVMLKLQRLSRSGGDDASSIVGRQFAAAVYSWETTRSLPREDGDLGQYLRWAAREELTPSEDGFLRAYEHEVSRRRLRAQKDAEEAKKVAEAALGTAKKNYRRARIWLAVSAVLAALAVGVGVVAIVQRNAALEARRHADEARQNADALAAELKSANDHLQQQKDIDDPLIAGLQTLLADPSTPAADLVERVKEKFEAVKSAHAEASSNATSAQKLAVDTARQAEMLNNLAYQRKQQLDICESARAECAQARTRCVVKDLPACEATRDRCVDRSLPACEATRDRCVGTDLPGCTAARDRCIGTDLPGCTAARDHCVVTDLPACIGARERCVVTDLPACVIARDQYRSAPNQCINTELPACTAARDKCVNTDLPACQRASQQLPGIP